MVCYSKGSVCQQAGSKSEHLKKRCIHCFLLLLKSLAPGKHWPVAKSAPWGTLQLVSGQAQHQSSDLLDAEVIAEGPEPFKSPNVDPEEAG